MLRTVISDFSRTLIFPKNPISFIELNEIHKNEVAKARNKNVYALNREDFILTERLYPAEEFFELNYPLLNLYKKLKEKNITLVIFTNSYIPTHPDLAEDLSFFDQIINVHDIGDHISKKDTQSYRMLCDKYNIIDSESIFIDDDLACIKAAEQQNIHTFQFPKIKGFTQEQLYEELNRAANEVELEINKLL